MACGLLWGGMPLRADTPALQVSPNERRFFASGYQMGRAAFAYAALGKRATEIVKAGDNLTQIQQLAALAPLAIQNREDARDGFGKAEALMETLHAPPKVLAPVRRAAARLAGPLLISGDARRVSVFSHKAGQTLAALDEYNTLSAIPDDAAIQHWLTTTPSGRVWYAEGLIAALAETAAAQQMPDLLPPVKEIATDLRGLRDWLALRLPDPLTPDQAALVAALNDFLTQTSRTGRPQAAGLTPPQLQALGDISQRLQSQILGDAPAPTLEKAAAWATPPTSN